MWAKLIEACADLGYGPNNLVRNTPSLQAHSERAGLSNCSLGVCAQVCLSGRVAACRQHVMCHMQAAENYDWRLSIVDLERRDNYFTILQNRVELLHSTNSEKVRVSSSHAVCAGGHL